MRPDAASFPMRSYGASFSLRHYHNCARSRKEAVEAARVLNNLTKKCNMHNKEIMTENEDQNTSNRKGEAFLLMVRLMFDLELIALMLKSFLTRWKFQQASSNYRFRCLRHHCQMAVTWAVIQSYEPNCIP